MIHVGCRDRHPPELPGNSGQDLQDAASDQLQTLSPISAWSNTWLTLRMCVHCRRAIRLEHAKSIATYA